MTPADTLTLLEADYANTPAFARPAELERINAIRADLGLPPREPNFDRPKPVRKVKAPPDHSEARAIYAAYLAKIEELRPHREYAKLIVAATNDDTTSKTPVLPLATMGTGGGPLLCDHCGEPMRLEGNGGPRDGVVDAAWTVNPDPTWVSWIKGGMVVEVTTNETLRVYHGYIGRPGHCCTEARIAAEKSEAAFAGKMTPALDRKLWDFLADEFPDKNERERCAIFGAIRLTLFSYDPGIGRNHP